MQYGLELYIIFAFILIESLSQYQEKPSYQKKILRNADTMTQIKIQLCQSWSFVGYFQEVKRQLELRYQDVLVTAEQYPLKNPRKMIYNIMISLEIIIISIILISDFIKPKIENYVNQDLINLFNENKLAKIAMVFMMGKYIGQIINNAGAFEVFCDNKLLWSTIEHNGIRPNLSTIVRLVREMK